MSKREDGPFPVSKYEMAKNIVRLREALEEEKALREEAEQSIDYYQHEIAMLKRARDKDRYDK